MYIKIWIEWFSGKPSCLFYRMECDWFWHLIVYGWLILDVHRLSFTLFSFPFFIINTYLSQAPPHILNGSFDLQSLKISPVHSVWLNVPALRLRLLLSLCCHCLSYISSVLYVKTIFFPASDMLIIDLFLGSQASFALIT